MKADKENVLRLLKTSRGQIEGLIKMVEDDRDCIEISTQILSSQSILKKINYEILKGHFSHCIKESLIENKGNIDKEIDEVLSVLEKLLK